MLPILFLIGCTGALLAGDRFSDEPEKPPGARPPLKDAESYPQALKVWKSAEDINAWIGAYFSYDRARAVRLSETQRTKDGQIPVHPPRDFFEGRIGVCVDLARFAVETLRSIDPRSHPKYLMIEFEPALVAGNTLRFHWLASFRRDGRIYFFADSKRPGHMAGPYADLGTFLAQYEEYRGRKIVAFREADSYEKRPRTRAPKEARRKP